MIFFEKVLLLNQDFTGGIRLPQSEFGGSIFL